MHYSVRSDAIALAILAPLVLGAPVVMVAIYRALAGRPHQHLWMLESLCLFFWLIIVVPTLLTALTAYQRARRPIYLEVDAETLVLDGKRYPRASLGPVVLRDVPKSGYSVEMTTQSGSTLTLADTIPDEASARWLEDAIRRTSEET